MSRLTSKLTVGVFVLLVASLPAFTATFAVGSCRPNLPSYSTISSAVGLVPAGSVVLVCPGTYNEQVHITQPLTLQGISSGNSDQAIIADPLSGLAINATDDFGAPVAAQVWVDNAAGPVNLTNLTVLGVGGSDGNCGGWKVNIFYLNTPGTVNQVAAGNHTGCGAGVGIYAEGGPASPAVLIENSSIHDLDYAGVWAQTNASSPALTLSMKSNNIKPNNVEAIGIRLQQGINATVSGNVLAMTGNPVSPQTGILIEGNSTGSVLSNTVLGADIGIQAVADGISVKSNRLFTNTTGILVNTPVAAIQNNNIGNSTTGIDFNCTPNPNVTHNTINDAQTGIADVPTGLFVPNTYYNVATIATKGPC